MSSAPASDALVSRIRSFRKEADWSYARLATEAGLSRAALLGMDSRGWSPTITTTRRLEALIPNDWEPGQPLEFKPKSKRRAA